MTLHAHTSNGWPIRFWKPKKERHIYDFDTLKDYLFRIIIGSPLTLLKKKTLKTRLALAREKRAENLWEKLREDPDKVQSVGLWSFLF